MCLIPTVAQTCVAYITGKQKVSEWTLKYSLFANGAETFLQAGRGPRKNMPSFARPPKVPIDTTEREIENKSLGTFMVQECEFHPSQEVIDFMAKAGPGEWSDGAANSNLFIDAEWISTKESRPNYVVLHVISNLLIIVARRRICPHEQQIS